MNQELSEDQVKELQEKLKDMSPEEIQEMMKKQCLFCNIVEGNIKSNNIYEDDKCIAVLDINPATKGHVLLFPKEHFQILNHVPDDLVGYLFKIANKISGKVFDALKPEGTSIYLGSGQIAGQNVPHVVINIIPRFKDDKVSIGWQGVKISDGDMIKLREELSNSCKSISMKKEIKVEEPKVEQVEDNNEERIP